MKKLISVLLLLSVAAVNAFSQEAEDLDEVNTDIHSNEVYLAVGTSSWIGLFSSIFVGVAGAIEEYNNGSSDIKDNKSAFSLSAGYNHFFWDHLGVGGFVNFEKMSVLNLLEIQARVTGQYGFEHFKFYHAVSGGVLFVTGTNGGVIPMYDVTLLGLKFDYEKFNIFLETNFPATAILKLGASFKF